MWFALRSRHPFFFTTANPGIQTGGLFSESKIQILQTIPQRYLPITLFLSNQEPLEQVAEKVRIAGLSFPIIAKPDVGERGLLVKIIRDELELIEHLNAHPIDWILQEYISLPVEASIFYYRLPGAKKGEITSICLKEFLHFSGDGKTTIGAWMAADFRASKQLDRFKKEQPQLLEQVLPVGEKIILEPIGNHVRGTTFLNGNDWISPELETVFDQLIDQMQDMFYGRFDLRCQSMELLQKGQQFKVLEFNGIGAEPAHIYDPKIPIRKKYSEIFRHWKVIFQIYRLQKARGVKAESWSGMLKYYRNYARYMQQIRAVAKNQLPS